MIFHDPRKRPCIEEILNLFNKIRLQKSRDYSIVETLKNKSHSPVDEINLLKEIAIGYKKFRNFVKA
jgi:hypothetical protein